ncbi:hypothetical protein P9112_009756 [Eukaryota sp. TZLM1-RC]
MRVHCLGDSLTWGYTLPERNDHCTPYWKQLKQFSVTSASVPGYTSQHLHTLLDSQCQNVDVFIVLIGTNNLLQGQSVSIITANVKWLIEKLAKTSPNSTILLLEIPPLPASRYGEEFDFSTELNNEYESMCSQIDSTKFVRWVENVSPVLVDSVHPDGESYIRLGNFLNEYLAGMM